MATADPNDGIPGVQEHARRHVADLLSHTRGLQRVVELAEEYITTSPTGARSYHLDGAGAARTRST